jgi:hypothetical protein
MPKANAQNRREAILDGPLEKPPPASLNLISFGHTLTLFQMVEAMLVDSQFSTSGRSISLYMTPGFSSRDHRTSPRRVPPLPGSST